jgi:hypothetical protein
MSVMAERVSLTTGYYTLCGGFRTQYVICTTSIPGNCIWCRVCSDVEIQTFLIKQHIAFQANVVMGT